VRVKWDKDDIRLPELACETRLMLILVQAASEPASRLDQRVPSLTPAWRIASDIVMPLLFSTSTCRHRQLNACRPSDIGAVV